MRSRSWSQTDSPGFRADGRVRALAGLGASDALAARRGAAPDPFAPIFPSFVVRRLCVAPESKSRYGPGQGRARRGLAAYGLRRRGGPAFTGAAAAASEI